MGDVASNLFAMYLRWYAIIPNGTHKDRQSDVPDGAQSPAVDVFSEVIDPGRMYHGQNDLREPWRWPSHSTSGH